MKKKKKTTIYLIEPHPDDALGSASALLYDQEADVVVCTLTRGDEERDLIDLPRLYRELPEPLRARAPIVDQIKYGLEDLHWDERLDAGVGHEESVAAYRELYGSLACMRLKDAVRSIVEMVGNGDILSFPLGIMHPMHVLVGDMVLTCVKEAGLPVRNLWVYVDHPYDLHSLGSGRMRGSVEYLQRSAGAAFYRQDCADTDQAKAGEALRLIYGDVHHAEFAGALEHTFCSFYVTDRPRMPQAGLRVMGRNDVLFLTDQAVPFRKRGGLAEVSSDLARLCGSFVNEFRVLLPVHEGDKEKLPGRLLWRKGFHHSDGLGNGHDGIVLAQEYRGVIYYLVKVSGLLREEYGPSEPGVEADFAVLADAILGQVLPLLDYRPNILHCNDWHMGFIPFLMKTKYQKLLRKSRLRLLYTIHSYGYQGICDKEQILRLLGLGRENCRLCPACVPYCPLDRIQYLREREQRRIGSGKAVLASFMKAGIAFADAVSTVSAGYARELESYPDFWGVQVTGIRNGLCDDRSDPASDARIYAAYTEKDFKEKKAVNKLWLQRRCGLGEGAGIPLFCMVSRLSKVKGIDDVINILDRLMKLPLQLVIIGDDMGSGGYTSVLKKAVERYGGKFWYAPFDERLEFQVYAAADLLLMPSLSESCGMTQMLAMHYGVVPIVSDLSSMEDSVMPYYEERLDRGVGYISYKDDCWMLLEAVMEAVRGYKNPEFWDHLVRKNMITDFSWKSGSLKRYVELYHRLSEGSD